MKLPGCNGSNNSTHTTESHVSCESSKARLSQASHRRRPATRRCRPSCRPPHHHQGRPSDGLVIGHGTKGETAPHRGEESTFTPAGAPMQQHTASKVRLAIGCWHTSLLAVLGLVFGGLRETCLDSCPKGFMWFAAWGKTLWKVPAVVAL